MAKFYENIEVQGTISATTIYGDGSNLTGVSGSGTFTGGTVTGSTTFTNGLTSNTFSATTISGVSVNLLTLGLGAGSVSTNIAIGLNTLPSNTTGNTQHCFR
jgi:hypothetical protein